MLHLKSSRQRFIPLIVSLFFSAIVLAQPCNYHDNYLGPITVGNPYLGTDCFAPIDRYLARSITMSDLVGENTLSDGGWAEDCDVPETDFNQGCYFNSNGFLYNGDPQAPCPHFGYCPDRYWCDINMCADLNAAFIYDVATLWGGESNLDWVADKYFYSAATKAVQDINKAYDSYVNPDQSIGLRRPVIGASIYESISPDIKYVKIPINVIDAFVDEMTTEEYNYYFIWNQPVSFRFFKFDRVSSSKLLYAGGPDGKFKTVFIDGTPGYDFPVVDLNKIEARMWFYYCATKYIDDGYKFLHMGDLEAEAYFDYYTPGTESNCCENVKTYSLFNKIREYATTNNSFVIIGGANSTNENLDAKFFDYSDNLITDVHEWPIRPDESDQGDENYNPECLYQTKLITYSPDDGEAASIVNKYPPGTIAATGCTESNSAPYLLTFDNNGGYANQATDAANADLGGGADHYPANWTIWGYDEDRWLYEQTLISPECAANNLQDFVCNIKNIQENRRGYISVPGRITIMPYYDYVGIYRIYDHVEIQDKIYDPISNTGVWAPIDNTSINMSYTCTLYEDDCDAHHFKGYKSYTFTVPSPDCSTVYTWHIQNPDGSWQPFTYGTSRSFTPPVSGNYQIHLRQDNLGYAPSTYGTIEHTFIYTLATDCCGPYHDPQKNESEEATLNSDTKNSNSDFTIIIYPNPSHGNFTLEVELLDKTTDENIQMQITDFVGKLIFSENMILKDGVFKNQINLPKYLISGIYFLTITNENGISKTEKLAIQN